MRPKAILAVFLMVLSLSQLGINHNQAVDPPGLRVPEITALVADLDSDDIERARLAIVTLQQYGDNAAIALADEPLISVIQDYELTDSYTRGLAVQTLGIIAIARGEKNSRRSVTALEYELRESEYELIRSMSAHILGLTHWNSVRPYLAEAEQTDPSPIVRLAACESLMINTNGQYFSETCNYDENPQETNLQFPDNAGLSAAENASAMDPIMSDDYQAAEIYDWAMNHLLLPSEAYASHLSLP